MKAIQIVDVNLGLVASWSKEESLNWDEAFINQLLLGKVLVVDSELPEGHTIMSNSDFCFDYGWVSNFGTYGWSDIVRRLGSEGPSLDPVLNQKWVENIASTVNLPTDVCTVLLNSGWTLVVSMGDPAKWVQASPERI